MEMNSIQLSQYEEDTLIVKIDYYNKKEMLARLIWFMPMHHEPSIYFPEIDAARSLLSDRC